MRFSWDVRAKRAVAGYREGFAARDRVDGLGKNRKG
jgi:hypothetical protein